MTLLRRREALGLGAAAALAAALPGGAAAGPWWETDPIPLRSRAERKGLLFGTAIGPALDSDRQQREAVIAECNIVVPEYELKWHEIAVEPGLYRMAGADRRFAFARDHNMAFRGHTLIWPEKLPGWFAAEVGRLGAEDLMDGFIGALVGRYAGRVHSWDVVNEAVELGPQGREGWRQSPLLDLMGPRFIDHAFRRAHEVDPKARLIYNEKQLDLRAGWSAAKRAAVLRLLTRLTGEGVPIHGLGLQIHVATDGPEALDADGLASLCRSVAALGLEVLVTELDVSDQFAPADPAARDAAVANTYRAALDAVLQEPATTAVLTWGLSDRNTWLAENRPRADGLPVRPLPFDRDMRRKAAWGAIAEAIDRAPMRRPLFKARA